MGDDRDGGDDGDEIWREYAGPKPVDGSEPRAGRARRFDRAALRDAAKRSFREHTLRPCRGIAPEEDDGFGRSGIQRRYVSLTKALPLVGETAMRQAISGGVHLIEEIRSQAPWNEAALIILERQLQIALWSDRPWLQWRPLVLVGPPGSGKSHLARQLATASGNRSFTLNLAGADDVRLLAGTARGWRSAQPCWPAVAMAQAGVANPILVGEEIDKVGDRRGSVVHDVLLTMIERSTARSYFDSCLLAEVDMSACLWIFTANDITRLPAAFRSRVDVAIVAGPGIEHFALLMHEIRAGLALEWQVPEALLPDLPPHAWNVLRDAFARHRSVRTLRRHLEDALASLVMDGDRRPH